MIQISLYKALILFTIVVSAISASALAISKQRSALGYFLLGLVLPVIGPLIVYRLLPADAEPDRPRRRRSRRRRRASASP